MHTNRMNPKKPNRGLLLALAIIAVIVGTWSFVSPMLDKQTALKEQTRLLESISAGNGEIILDPKVAETEPDFYINEAETSAKDSESIDTSEVLEVVENVTPLVTVPRVEPTTIKGIGILTIDKISLNLPVVDGISSEHLKVAVGRVLKTAEIGEIGNAVIAGHRSYEYGQYFNRLGELENGDIISYTSIGGVNYSFEVFEISEIEPGDQIAFVQPTDESVITLYTCTPIRTATHRLLVRAVKIFD